MNQLRSKSFYVLVLIFIFLFIGCDERENEDEQADSYDDDDDNDDNDDDNNDNDDDSTSTIPGCVTGDFFPVFGMLHSHSLYSDGRGLPQAAYQWARDEGELDFFALSDHLEILHVPLPPDKWEKTMEFADQFYEPGVYVAMAGFEYSSGIDFEASAQAGQFVFSAHNNVFFVDHLFPMIMMDYHLFYDELRNCQDCLAQFNHPGWDGQTNWDGFEYQPDLDPQINLIEMSTWDVDAWPYLFECLDQGWHVSPTWNQDNHNGEWGTEDDHRTGAWVDELTREGIRDVFENRRSFSTLDKNATILLMAQNECWMGSELTGVSDAEFELSAFDPDANDGFVSIEFYGPGMELFETVDCGDKTDCSATIFLNFPQSGYVLGRANQTDGDVLISAPIWLYSN